MANGNTNFGNSAGTRHGSVRTGSTGSLTGSNVNLGP